MTVQGFTDQGSTTADTLDCLAEYLDCTVQELLDKIEEFKEEGCKLFEGK